jgi:hypothetical protein
MNLKLLQKYIKIRVTIIDLFLLIDEFNLYMDVDKFCVLYDIMHLIIYKKD